MATESTIIGVHGLGAFIQVRREEVAFGQGGNSLQRDSPLPISEFELARALPFTAESVHGPLSRVLARLRAKKTMLSLLGAGPCPWRVLGLQASALKPHSELLALCRSRWICLSILCALRKISERQIRTSPP
jgi:hypothetical protein